MHQESGLYDSKFEHDACGVGMIANIKGKRSHSIVLKGLEILKNLTHRGAVGADLLQGDGAGILLQIPDELYRDEMLQQGITLPPYGEYGVGMIFLPREAASQHACQEEIERAILSEGQTILGWRDVSIDKDMPMSKAVKEKEPVIKQVFIGHSPDLSVTDAFERKLYIIRKKCSIAIYNLNLKHCKEFYIPSFSTHTVVYKGQLLASQVGIYYKDLTDSRCTSAFAIIHQRFSTNTFPQWSLAHPFRMIAHNGEINTLRGNFNWILAREKNISSPLFGSDLQKLWPLIFQDQSDSASFDNAVELLTMSGYPIAQAIMMMVPEAWEKNQSMDPKLRAFYEYHAAMMEPWDGPAAIVFTDGRQIGAALDRNGLRPARYYITDEEVILASEAGVLPVEEKKIVRKLRLEPGRMLLIDLEQGRIIDDHEIKTTLSTLRPYREWVEKLRFKLDHKEVKAPETLSPLNLNQLLKVFAYNREEVDRIIKNMAQNGQEPIMSMGNDAPLAVLSQKSCLLYDYFRQMFAQVTNPPIDPIREELVTSLVSFIGPRPNLLDIVSSNPPVRLEVEQPILTDEEMEQIRRISSYTSNKFRVKELDITYPLNWGSDGIEARLESIKAAAVDAVKSGVNILIVTDKNVSADRVAIPALLALSAVHLCLVANGLRTSTGLVVETGSARLVHHFALLAGYGAEAIHPYAALSLVKSMGSDLKEQDLLLHNYIKSIDKGLAKIMAKMGISTYMSYIGAQIFEAVGLNSEFIGRYFTNTNSPIEGIGLFEVAKEAVRSHKEAFAPKSYSDDMLTSGGNLNFRTDGEEHMWTPEAVILLQESVREKSYDKYKKYAQIINDQSKRLMTIRGMFKFKAANPIPLSEVESADNIVKRFSTAAMSMGSISAEAHCTLAIAMNRLGGMSNSGEGGEDPKRFEPIKEDTVLTDVLGDNVVVPIQLKKGDSLRSRIKQVASGRFGVTASYLESADVIQIKMAQGAKPGEGGQLPGHKVSPYIAYLRHCLPGIGLISPPPHHDIYSIEDLSELIYDLKLINPKAEISVKLVSEHGIGTVAAGVAKCKADHMVISGHDGGTGAAPVSSVKNTGSAWEIGLAEVEQTLQLNNLRSRVRLQVDGQIKTGRDVVIGAILGADEFGFGTAPLVTLGCVLMRKCQKNTCPAGIATQDPVLRKNFKGQADFVINYFYFVAEEAREIMASLGIRKIDDLIGRVDLLDKKQINDSIKAHDLSFKKIFFKVASSDSTYNTTKQQHDIDKALDSKFLNEVQNSLKNNKELSINSSVANTNRAVGTLISNAVTKNKKELADNFITLNLQGTAGQSFGAFLAKGITLNLTGEANDYVGKGLSGGIIKIRKAAEFSGKADENIIAGNTCLYGATSGKAFLNGRCGERFAVRNSGATAICEGCGDHGCEYMTGGTVMILGPVNRNFGAGMSGGIAYVYDPEHTLNNYLAAGNFIVSYCNEDSKHHGDFNDKTNIYNLLQEHVAATDSHKAAQILNDFDHELENFAKVLPQEYLKALQSINKENA
ncbi:glutamate synthase large subunit [Succinatimonas hippei]|uniref:glutamate synthase large subunit n=1 Tax=Succinatimonas hippei TaxID=626938 RepID=UPI0025A49CB2|nr:glutamate synthase large subunit [Succinatimonas hippei]MDM8119307.1 glutamate synthase large subunit [Succinatimonas hippei]